MAASPSVDPIVHRAAFGIALLAVQRWAAGVGIRTAWPLTAGVVTPVGAVRGRLGASFTHGRNLTVSLPPSNCRRNETKDTKRNVVVDRRPVEDRAGLCGYLMADRCGRVPRQRRDQYERSARQANWPERKHIIGYVAAHLTALPGPGRRRTPGWRGRQSAPRASTQRCWKVKTVAAVSKSES